MPESRILCALDPDVGKALHGQGQLWHDAYYPELLDELGVCYDALPVQEAQRRLASHRVLVLTGFDASGMVGLEAWVRAGGTLIAFLTTGLDALFGIQGDRWRAQADDDFSIAAYMRLPDFKRLPGAAACEYNLPILSPARILRADGAQIEADLLDPTSFCIRRADSLGAEFAPPSFAPALLTRRVGLGRCAYFNYNMAQTLRAMHQGRPVDRDWDGDGMYRSPDGIVLTSAHDLQDPFADYHLELLRSFLDEAGVLCKHCLPPQDGAPVDLLFYYGGDDECDPSGVQEIAAEKMRALGLPYHYNIMCDAKRQGFAVTREAFDKFRSYGQETSIHFDFFRPLTKYTKEEFTEQLDLYEAAFGQTPEVYVNHCLMFNGWTDQARWSAERGLKGDNGRLPCRVMPQANPINSYGFAFGTAYPHFIYDDAAHEDRKLDFLYIPITMYEPRVYAATAAEDRAALESRLSQGVENARILSLFFHPVYIARDEDAWRALLAAHEIAARRGWRVLNAGVDELARWWFDRSATDIAKVSETEFRVEVAGTRGVVLRLPAAWDGACLLDGRAAPIENRTIGCRPCALVAVPAGRHTVEIK